jgi:formylglycine-generating enzyme required for sulfatase activity
VTRVAPLRRAALPTGRWLAVAAVAAVAAIAAIAAVAAIAPRAAAQTVAASGPRPAAAAESMVAIAGGTYPIGDDASSPDERPAHRVTLAPFRIDRHEVTNAEYAAFLHTLDLRPLRDAAPGRLQPADVGGADAPRLFERDRQRRAGVLYIALDDEDVRIGVRDGRFAPEPGFERHPVNEVTWTGALAYCRWRGARLPTEAELAARGSEGRRYPWGDEAPTPRHAVYARRSGGTEPVGSLPAGTTPEGVTDLAGNVAEWTSSLYRPYPYRADDGREDPQADGERVTRGGDHVFDASPDRMRATFRAGFSRAPDAGHRHIGLRCAR